MKEQLKGLEKEHGNIDVLSHRISNVRTWSYVANKKNWVEISIKLSLLVFFPSNFFRFEK